MTNEDADRERSRFRSAKPTVQRLEQQRQGSLTENDQGSAVPGQICGHQGSVVPSKNHGEVGLRKGTPQPPHSTAAAMVSQSTQVVTIITYNVVSLNLGREADILECLKISAVIGLQSTCRRRKELSHMRTVFNYTCVVCPTDASDRCSGVQVCVHERMGKI